MDFSSVFSSTFTPTKSTEEKEKDGNTSVGGEEGVDNSVNWNEEPTSFSSEWGKGEFFNGGEEKGEESGDPCASLRSEDVASMLTPKKKNEDTTTFREFEDMDESARMQYVGKLLNKKVKAFLKSALPESEFKAKDKATRKKMQRTYTVRLITEGEGDLDKLWKLLRDDKYREDTLKMFVDMTSPARAANAREDKPTTDETSDAKDVEGETDLTVSFAKPTFSIGGDDSNNNDFNVASTDGGFGSNNPFETAGEWKASGWGATDGGESGFASFVTAVDGKQSEGLSLGIDENNKGFGFGNFDTGDTQVTFSSFMEKAQEAKEQEEKVDGTSDDDDDDNVTYGAHNTFSIEGKRGRFEESHATHAVSNAAPSLQSSCRRICFNTQSVTEPGAVVLAKYVAGMKNLVVADIADMISGIPTAEALKTLRHISVALSGLKKLREINLSDNALGPRGIKACEAVLRSQPKLRALYLENDGLSAEACSDVADYLLSAVPNNTLSLRTLHFYNNMSGDGGGEHVARIVKCCPDLEDFRLGSTRCLEKGGTALGHALKRCLKLKKLDCADNSFMLGGAKAVAEAVSNMKDLEILNLGDLSLTSEGVSAVCAAIRGNASLEELYLGFNEAGVEASEDLANTIASLPSLRVLDLEGSELGDEGAAVLAKGLKSCTKIERLNVKSNEMTTKGARQIVESLRRATNLTNLDMSENSMSKAGIAILKRALSQRVTYSFEDCFSDEDEDFDVNGIDGVDDEDYVPSDGGDEEKEEEDDDEAHATNAKVQWDPTALKAMLPPADSWKCEVCCVPNGADLKKCRSCGASKPGEDDVGGNDGGFNFGSSSADLGGITFGTGTSNDDGAITFGTTSTTIDEASSFGGFGFGTTAKKDDQETTKTSTFTQQTNSVAPRLLIDTDGGVDDAIALLMAFSCSTAKMCTVDSITTVFGNVSAAQAAKNVEGLLYEHARAFKSFERSVPVVVGSETALVGVGTPPPQWPGHGVEGVGDAKLATPPADFVNRKTSEHAAMHIVRRCRDHPGEITIVALGPVTNVALALKLEPSLPKLVKKVIVMGGTSRGRGNTTATAEFNTYCDPEAQHVVFEAFEASKLVMVCWEDVVDASFTWDDLDRMCGSGTPMGGVVKSLFGAYKRIADKEKIGFCPCDAYTMAVALRPDTAASETRSLRAFVELQGRSRGATVFDLAGRMDRSLWPKRENATLVCALNRAACLDMVEKAVRNEFQ